MKNQTKVAAQLAASSDAGSGIKRRGFASMDKLRQREIASLGGRSAHENGRAHEFTSEEARAAGRKGGAKRAAARKAAGKGA